MKILVLEDDKWFAESLRDILKKDFDIRICHDPEKVFNILEKWWPDMLLSDVILGAKNLFVLLNEIHSYTDTRTLPVIILSTTSKPIALDDVTQYNVQKVLNKAEITPNILRKTLREIRQKESDKIV